MITVKEFSKYLTKLNLTHSLIFTNQFGLFATVLDKPNLSNFSRSTQNMKKNSWNVIIYTNDIHNKSITNNFFTH